MFLIFSSLTKKSPSLSFFSNLFLASNLSKPINSLGAFWLSRWALYFYCVYFPDSGIMCHGEPTQSDWMPGEWGILVQAIVFVVLGTLQWMQNDRVKATILPRLVTVLSPLVILLIGATIWVDWADGDISLPLILATIALTGAGMWFGSTSNRAPLFLSSAFLSSFIPFVYELNVGGGAGLSLLAIVVLMVANSFVVSFDIKD